MFAVLGLGSNKTFGSFDSLHLLAAACVELKTLFSDFKVSSVYRTKPMYVENQSDFFNMAVCGETVLSPYQLLSHIHKIEECYGRNRDLEIRNGARSLDIDIELYGNEEIHFSDLKNPMNNLEVPHPRICERAFVLIPLLEVLPESSDIKNKKILENSLSKIGNQDAQLIVKSSDFLEILNKVEHSYGRECKITKST